MAKLKMMIMIMMIMIAQKMMMTLMMMYCTIPAVPFSLDEDVDRTIVL